MVKRSAVELVIASRTVRSTRNPAPKYTSTSKRNPRIMFRGNRRTKARPSVKLTEEQRISILEVFNKDLHFSKDAAGVASSESIITLAEKMNVPSLDVCDWLGITDELNEIIYLASRVTEEEIAVTLEKMTTNLDSSEGAVEVDCSEKVGDEMDEDPCQEVRKPIRISINLSVVKACSSKGSGSGSSSVVSLTGAQKESILDMLKKDLDSNTKVLKVGSPKHIQELANQMEVPTSDMREWLGITDDLNQVIANLNVKVRGLECQTHTEMKEEVGDPQKEYKEDTSSEKVLEIEDDFYARAMAENYQEPEEELTPRLARPIPADEEQVVQEWSVSFDEDDDEKFFSSEEMEFSDSDSFEDATEAICDPWAEEMQEYLKVSPANEDGNELEVEMLRAIVGNKSQKDVMEPSASQSTSEPKVLIKRKTRIDDYFQATKSMKKA